MNIITQELDKIFSYEDEYKEIKKELKLLRQKHIELNTKYLKSLLPDIFQYQYNVDKLSIILPSTNTTLLELKFKNNLGSITKDFPHFTKIKFYLKDFTLEENYEILNTLGQIIQTFSINSSEIITNLNNILDELSSSVTPLAEKLKELTSITRKYSSPFVLNQHLLDLIKPTLVTEGIFFDHTKTNDESHCLMLIDFTLIKNVSHIRTEIQDNGLYKNYITTNVNGIENQIIYECGITDFIENFVQFIQVHSKYILNMSI